MLSNITPIAYVAVSILFIFSLSGLASQKKAKMGNAFGIIGMVIALFATFLDMDNFDGIATFWIFMIPGAIIGIFVASRVVMTSMPQLVAALHSFVGLAAVLVGIGKFFITKDNSDSASNELTEKAEKRSIIGDVETFLGIFIGAITFTGSVVAFGKLQGLIRSAPLIIGGNFRHVLNLLCLIACVAMNVVYVIFPHDWDLRLIFLLVETGIAFFVGWHLIMAIGGADMPVVISMLNSYSGWATALAGFMLHNNAMIVTGSLVGSSGAILSYIMCTAMNRSFISVILGGFGGEDKKDTKKKSDKKDGDKKDEPQREVIPIDCKGVCDELINANRIIIVPGYGLAVAHGQHAVASIAEVLRSLGKTVLFDIHPVAGRLPGHMNVLLAEANVPYDIVMGMDELNDSMPETDVCIVVGANDIVNPAAINDPDSPIAGMPIIETFNSKLVIVNKRTMASGYAGIENPLFFNDNTRMFFGDARKAFEEVLGELTRRKAEMKPAADTAAGAGSTAGGAAAAAKGDVLRPEDLPPPFCILGVPKEVTPLERMVALTPNACARLRKKGFGIVVESGAGEAAKFPDSEYKKALCDVFDDVREVYKRANVICKVQPPVQNHPTLNVSEVSLLHEGQTTISFLYPNRNPGLVDSLTEAKVTSLGMDFVPRITRAQKLDALSSLANLAGYRAVIESAHAFGRVFTGQITAAGKMPAAQVFIIGAGVAGLAAIGTAKSLGAIVKAFDVRNSVKEQIESMGGEFCPVQIDEDAEDASGYAKKASDRLLEAERALFAEHAPVSDIIITTASIPNQKAPVLLTTEIVKSMRPGSVIVDLAAPTGGNCELTKPGETIIAEGVTIIGNTDLTARMAPQGSSLYSNNIINLLDMLVDKKAKEFRVNLEDEIVRAMCVCKEGKNLFPPPKISVSAAPKTAKKPAAAVQAEKKEEEQGYGKGTFIMFAGIGVFLICMIWFPEDFIAQFMNFVLAVIVGFHVIWSVTPALHTPLMSVTNAISGIIAIGGMLCLGTVHEWDATTILGGVATLIASINIFGGFFITYRMLSMFHD